MGESSGFTHQNQFGPEGLTYPHAFGADINNIMPVDNPWIEGGMYTTMDDYGKLLMMHLNGGVCGMAQVHSDETIQRMHADRILEEYEGVTGSLVDGYGMGWWFDRSDVGMIYDPGAYGSWPYIDKNRNIAVFIVLEATVLPDGYSFYSQLRPAIEQAFDAMTEE